jgi:hypothetical protein
MISRQYIEWDNYRQPAVQNWKETSQYVYATDTTRTSNSKLPWSNKTTIPKLCQIRDNLYANYMASMFPKRKWLIWEGSTQDDETAEKISSIESYMSWVIDRNEFYDEMSKLVLDYIDYGNCFGIAEWLDKSMTSSDGKDQVGYVGPSIRRISPLDLVFNPTAPSFDTAPKIVRSFVSIGDVEQMLATPSAEENEKKDAQELLEYMKNIRSQFSGWSGTVQAKDDIYDIAGYTNFQAYLGSGICEVLTFYGDLYDYNDGKLQRNRIIKIVDRHKIISNIENPSYFGTAPIFHCGWRIRPDSLWAMGPLDNLVGMQYRIDHLENMKADIVDLVTYPVLKIKGYVEDFNWEPMARIYVGDDGDVDIVAPQVEVLKLNTEIQTLQQTMEEMAGAPKEAMGFRSPGEKTAYEVQRMENAASRIFQSRTNQFERGMTENLLNGCLELARRNINKQTIRVFDTEFKIATFTSLTPEDITGNGRLRPIAARHFAEQAQLVQNLTSFYSSALASDPDIKIHFSSVQLAKLFEHLLEIEDYNIVTPYVRLSEQADAHRIQNASEAQVQQEIQTPAGTTPGDFSPGKAISPGAPLGLPPASGQSPSVPNPGAVAAQGLGIR